MFQFCPINEQNLKRLRTLQKLLSCVLFSVSLFSKKLLISLLQLSHLMCRINSCCFLCLKKLHVEGSFIAVHIHKIYVIIASIIAIIAIRKNIHNDDR